MNSSSSISNNTTSSNLNSPKTVINQRYLGSSILDASNEAHFLTVKSGMGTGKTTALKEIINNLPSTANILFISPRKKLNFAMAHDLDVNYYEDVKNESNLQRKNTLASRMVVTPQSLAAILKDCPEIRYEYLVMDESESIASMIVSEACSDKISTLEALRNASLKAQHVIAMDAHLSTLTSKLVSLLADTVPVQQLINSNKSWDNFTANIITGSNLSKRKDENNHLQEQAIQQGKRIAICSNSANYCESRHAVLVALYPALSILLITGKTSKEAQALLSNPDSIKDHDIVIFSPAVSVGVSFDLPSHINEVFGVFINNLGTGGSDDAIQSLARIRKPINQLWTITLDNETQVYNAKPSLPVDIIESLSSRLTRSCFLGKVTNLAITDEESRIMELYATVHHENMIDKNSFNANFTHTLDQMGITINEIGLTTPINNESKELTKQHKEDKKQEAINIKTNSAPIDHAEYERITSKRKFKPDEVTMQESGSLERFIFERKYSIDCDLLNKKEIELYLAHDDNGTISKLINREIAHAPKDFIKNYMNARIRGLGANGAFQVDLLSNKLNLPMLKQVLGYALPYTEGATYDHQSLKRSPMARFVAKHEKEIKALEVITLPRNWKQKPALLLNHLLDLLGYGHSSKQTNPKKGKRIYSYQCQLVDANEALSNLRATNGSNWVNSTDLLIDLYDSTEIRKVG